MGALLAVAVAAVHVADQGSVTALNSPDWIGWGYRLIEVGGVLTALALLVPRPARLGPAWLGWAAGVLLGAGPFLAYIASRTVGVPGDPSDVGNWGYWVGTVSLVVEAALVVLSAGMLLALRQRPPLRRRPEPDHTPAGHAGTQITMLTAVMDAAAAGEEAIAAAGHDDLPPAPAVSVTTGLEGTPLAAGRRNMS
jgi:hypothetical protein